MAAEQPQLDVAIVAYRCEALLRDCLTSLREHPPSRPMRVHVVDNASGDGTPAMVEREFGEVVLTASEENLGFSRANNIVIEAGSAPYVLALNPDTRVTEGALDTMLELMDSRPEIGISGPSLELEDGSFDHAARRSFPTPLSALGHFTGLGRREGAHGALADYRAPAVDSGPVDAVNGAFMLIRREALEQVGAFDEGYWMYMEDLDLCYRFAQAGWPTFYEPSATVIHVKAGTSGKARSLKLNRAFHYGMFRFYREHYAPKRNPLVNGAVYGGIAGKLGISATRSAWTRRVGRARPSRPRLVPLDQVCRFEPVLAALDELGGGTLLDVGSGSTGVSSLATPAWQATALDLDFSDYGAVEHERDYAVKRVQGDARALPFADRSFDAVIAIDMLEHIAPADRATVLAELSRVASRRLVVACPTGPDALEADRELLAAFERSGVEPPFWLGEHLDNGFPTEREFAAILDGHGTLRVLGNETASSHLRIMRAGRRRPAQVGLALAGRLLLPPIGARAPLRRRLIRALRGGDAEPRYRSVFILDVNGRG